MKIAFWGSSLVSAYWNGAATYYRGILRALATLGYEVTFFEPDAYERQKHRDMEDPEWARIVVYDPADCVAIAEQLSASLNADVVVKASGVGVLDEVLEHAISQMPSALCKVFWDVDAPATLGRLHADNGDAFHKAIRHFDLVLTYGGGQRVVDEYRTLGARECIPVYNAFDPETHFPVAPDARFSSDLSFLGNRLPDREQRVEEFFLSTAARTPEKRFLLGGNGWADKPVSPNVRYVGHVYTADHNVFNCSALAVLNISRDSMAEYGFSPATRVFEAAAAAACIITDDWEGIDYFLKPGEEVLIARDGGEVAQLVQQLSPARAYQIGEAARKRVIREHTYHQRASLVNETLRNQREMKRQLAVEVHA